MGGGRGQVPARPDWFSGGLVQLGADDPEPRVVPWTDVETVTVAYRYETETAPEITDCTLRASTTTELADLGRHAAAPKRRGQEKLVAEVILSGVPNGFLLPHLVVYAAARNGVPVHGKAPGAPGSPALHPGPGLAAGPPGPAPPSSV